MPVTKQFFDTLSASAAPPVLISVVVPVYNEEESLEAFYEAVSAQLNRLETAWELVFVNDGSKDRSAEILSGLHREDARVKILNFSRNFGNQAAITAGLRFAQGNAIITMDADLQHPPEMIPEMVRLWKEGYHSVYTVRTYGGEVGTVKRQASSWYAKTLNYFSGLAMPEGISDFRLLDRRVVEYINGMEENSRFLRAMISWLGFRQIGIPFTAPPRVAGKTKFSALKLLKLSVDGITSFSVHPLRWITYFGLTVAAVSLLYAMYVLYEAIFLGIATPGWPTLIITVLFLGGVQLISLGLVGEYVGRIYTETKRRPLFVLQEKIGFEAGEQAMPKVFPGERTDVA